MIDRSAMATCEDAARIVVRDVLAEIEGLTTSSVERAVARLCGGSGGEGGVNTVVENLIRKNTIGQGSIPVYGAVEAVKHMRELQDRINARRAIREELDSSDGTTKLYVLTATGDVDEDVTHALAVAEAGGDIVAILRSTAQSLLDHVPEGATHEGYGGTFATQENFRIMRAALDEWAERNGRYIRLSSFCSGLCMPEIAVIGAMEGFDNMVNDCMYGILYRDINPVRTMVDQMFSRLVNAWAGIVINTGEDNYPRTADGMECMPSVVASWYINYFMAREAGLRDEQIGLGLAFEVDPDLPDSFLNEVAHARLLRELFPGCPVKYMPPTRHMTGDMWRTQSVDAMFNLVAAMVRPGIQTIGVPSEGIFTPHIQDRVIGLDAARYAHRAAGNLGHELMFSSDGAIKLRMDAVIREAATLLERIAEDGFFEAIEGGTFGDVKRPRAGGRGGDSVFEKTQGYLATCEDWMRDAIRD